jgi:hypothetical protein
VEDTIPLPSPHTISAAHAVADPVNVLTVMESTHLETAAIGIQPTHQDAVDTIPTTSLHLMSAALVMPVMSMTLAPRNA